MRIPKKRCNHCGRWFEPYLPQRDIQRFCPRKRCQRARHRQACQSFHRANPDHDEGRRDKIRCWAQEKGYWAGWRKENPGYREREKARMRKKRQATKSASLDRLSVAKRDAWTPVSLEPLRKIQSQTPEIVAKPDAWDPRVDALLAWLIAREASQNETHARLPAG